MKQRDYPSLIASRQAAAVYSRLIRLMFSACCLSIMAVVVRVTSLVVAPLGVLPDWLVVGGGWVVGGLCLALAVMSLVLMARELWRGRKAIAAL